MNFTTSHLETPPNAFPCLAVITLGSDGSRVIDLDPTSVQHFRLVYWRANVGVTEDSLVITPRDSPANSLMEDRPTRPDAPPSIYSGFPGVIDGKPLAGITIPFSYLDGRRLTHSIEPHNSFVEIPVIQKATLRFEFDDWLTAKGSVEVLYTQLQSAFDTLAGPSGASTPKHPTRRLSFSRQDSTHTPHPSEVSTPFRSQEGTRAGRDSDGSTHPSGDAAYKHGWKEDVRGKW